MSNLKPLDVWERGIQPLLPTAGLKALAEACRTDDPALIEYFITTPGGPVYPEDEDLPCQYACAMAYASWKGEGLKTAGEVEAAYCRLSRDVEIIFGNTNQAVFCFTSWWDDPAIARKKKLRLLLRKLKPEIARRKGA